MASKFLRIEHKSFDFQSIGDDYDFLKISENGRAMRISMFLDKESYQCLSNNLLELSCGNGHRGWVRKFKALNSTLLLEYHQNGYGSYGRLTGIFNKGGSRFLIIPGGVDGSGWRYFADIIRGFLRIDRKGGVHKVIRNHEQKMPHSLSNDVQNPLMQAGEVKKPFNVSNESRWIGDWK